MREGSLNIYQAEESANVFRLARSALDLARHDQPVEECERISQEIEELLERTPQEERPVAWNVMAKGLRVLASRRRCVALAVAGDDRVASERARLQVHLDELRVQLRNPAFVVPSHLAENRKALAAASECDPHSLIEFLFSLPLPTIYSKATEERFPSRETNEPPDTAPPPLIRLIVLLDHVPAMSPQLVKTNLLYPLEFRFAGLHWPERAQRLHLDFLTTCPSTEYAVSPFVFERPKDLDTARFEGRLTGQIRLSTAQSGILDDLVFGFRAAFEGNDGRFDDIPVIGQHELRLRVVSQDSSALATGNRRLDRHIQELLLQLTNACPDCREEVPELLPVLEALTSLIAAYAQEAIYKGRSNIPESEFQATVLRDLRIKLGTDVQEHPSQAGGKTDIRYRGVIIELKVEDSNGDREYICRKYTAQTAQYAGVEARQVSVLLVLDLTEKKRPPGDIRNDILLADVETHGGGDSSKRYPSKAFVFVVNGNMNSPSDYSR